MCRNEETFPTQSLTIPDTSSHIDENQESWYLEDFDQDSISPENLELDQYQPCLLYTSPSPRDRQKSRMPSSA